MGVETAKIPANQRLRLWDQSRLLQFPDQSTASLSDMDFGFLDNAEDLSECSSGYESREIDIQSLDQDDEDKDLSGSLEESKNFWEKQHQGLQGTLYKSSSIESRIRNSTKEAVSDIQTTGKFCVCGRSSTSCYNCLIREVFVRLQNENFNSAICKTKWRSSKDIPSGDHTFLDVIDNSSKKGEIRVIIELNFRSEFEMARAGEEYNRLVQRLPEVFVGKVERLHSVIKIICAAAKKCMKEKKMHMGPWRKQRYMQAKWLSTCVRNTSTPFLCVGYDSRNMTMTKTKTKPKVSMLTSDLKYVNPTVVEVL